MCKFLKLEQEFNKSYHNYRRVLGMKKKRAFVRKMYECYKKALQALNNNTSPEVYKFQHRTVEMKSLLNDLYLYR